MIIRCCGYIVKQIFTVIVFVIFPTGKCIAVMLGRCRESCFVESGSDFVLLGSDHGAVNAVNKSYCECRLFPVEFVRDSYSTYISPVSKSQTAFHGHFV